MTRYFCGPLYLDSSFLLLLWNIQIRLDSLKTGHYRQQSLCLLDACPASNLSNASIHLEELCQGRTVLQRLIYSLRRVDEIVTSLKNKLFYKYLSRKRNKPNSIYF